MKYQIILRNIELNQCEEFVSLLEDNQLDTIEITLNSPDHFSCIELITNINRYSQLSQTGLLTFFI